MDESTAVVISALAAAASALLTLLAVAVAVRTLNASRDDSRERSRAFVVPELRRELLSQGTINMRIRNVGPTSARDVEVQFDPPPPAELEELPDDNMWKWVYRAYAKKIDTWPPGWTLSNVVRAGHDDISEFSVTVSYSGIDGTKYRDTFRLDPEPLLRSTASSPSDTGDAPNGWEKRKVRALEALVQSHTE